MHPLGNLPRGLLDHCWIQGFLMTQAMGVFTAHSLTHSPTLPLRGKVPLHTEDFPMSGDLGSPQEERHWPPVPKALSGSHWTMCFSVKASRTTEAMHSAEQLYCLTGRRCQKHVYLQTSCRPAKQQSPAGCETAWQARLRADPRSVLEPRTGTM